MAVPGGPNPMELELTVVSAKHIKNVNWRSGDLNPYVTFWVDPDRRISTKSDGSGSTKPVWNQTFSLPISSSVDPSILLTLEIFHSNPSEPLKPLVGTARVRIADLLADSPDSDRLHSLDVLRPSGRPQGKIRIKISLREQPPPPPTPQPSHPPPGYPDYNYPPQSGLYYSSAPPPPQQQRDYRDYPPPMYSSAPPPPPPMYNSAPPPRAPPSPYGYPSYPDAYSGYHPGYYPRPPPPQPQPQPQRAFPGYGGPTGPSAPVESSSYEQRSGGASVGNVIGSVEGLSLDERGRSDRADESARDNFSDYRGKY